MRQFASGGFRIWNLSREAKLVYTGFGLFSLLALLVSMLFYEDLVGGGTAGVKQYYAGESRAPGVSAPPSPSPANEAGGPKIDLPDEAQPKLVMAVTYRKLLEVTHFHLFTVPVFLLIIAHLFMLTGLSPTAKAAWIVAAWLSALLHLAAPWLVRYGSSALAWTYPVSGALMAVSMTTLTVYPMIVMWRPREVKRSLPDGAE
ncbi:MAG TPA: hypothetical protein VFF06_06255 [Polyangia bacterium]|nr:hypothetical protein [Polyangia bacterium]